MLHRNRSLSAVFLCLLWFGGLRMGAATQDGVFQELPLDRALALAAEQKRLVFIDFYTTRCGACQKLDQYTWTNIKVIKLLKAKTIALKIDAGKELSLRKKYAIQAYPTLLLLKPDGAILDRMLGYQPPEDFLASMANSLADKDPLVLAREVVAGTESSGLTSQIEARHQLAQTLAQQNQDPEALKEFLWLYDSGMNREGYAQARGSVAIELEYLARRYPPAMEALRQRREAARISFLNAPSTGSAQDFKSLFSTRDWGLACLEVFDRLPLGSPGRVVLNDWVWDVLIHRRRYAEAAELRPLSAFLIANAGLECGINDLKSDQIAYRANRNFYVALSMREVEALAGVGNLTDARTLMKKVLFMDASVKTRQLLLKHLERAGHPELLN